MFENLMIFSIFFLLNKSNKLNHMLASFPQLAHIYIWPECAQGLKELIIEHNITMWQ